MRKKGRQDLHQQQEWKKNHEKVLDALKNEGFRVRTPKNNKPVGLGLRMVDLEDITGLSRPALQKHLRSLKNKRIVIQEGKQYFLAGLNKLLKAQLDALKKNDLFLRGLFQDRRFDELVYQKLAEGFQVREDVLEDGQLKVKIHSFGFEELIDKCP